MSSHFTKISNFAKQEFASTNFVALAVIAIPLLYYSFHRLREYIEPFYLKVENTNQHGGELVAQVLKHHKIKYIFTLVGGHISPILVASKHLGMSIIDVRNEATCVFAADAVSRLTGIPGVAVVTAGPGVTNTITAMKNAQMAQSPLVLIGGAAATFAKGRGSLQDVEQINVLKSIVKYNTSVNNIRQIVPKLKRAFYEAMSGVPGPVFVEMPIDMLYCVGEVRASMKLGLSMRKSKLNKNEIKNVIIPSEYLKSNNINVKYSIECNDINIINKYLDSLKEDETVFLKRNDNKLPFIVKMFSSIMIQYIFAGGFDRKWDFNPIRIDSLIPPMNDCIKILQSLKDAKKPCMIVGSQALLNSSLKEEVRRAVEAIGIPCFLSGMARGLLGREEDYRDAKQNNVNSRAIKTGNKNARFLHIRQNRSKALKESDFIILAGVPPDFRLDYGRSLSKKAKIISINRSYNDLTLNTDIIWKPYMTMQYDVGLTLIKLSKILQDSNYKQLSVDISKKQLNEWNVWINELLSLTYAKESENIGKSKRKAYARHVQGMKSEELLNPLSLCGKMDELMSDDSIIIVDGGDFAATAAYTMKPRGPLGWMDPGPFGTLGVGAGFALGAKLVCPEKEIWLIWGDGSCGYSIAEIDTFARFNLGVICVIGNDACWSQIEREQLPKLRDNVACPLVYCDYHKVSEGYGGKGDEIWNEKQISGQTKEDNMIIKAKYVANEEHMPYVLNAHIGRSNFREGSISV